MGSAHQDMALVASWGFLFLLCVLDGLWNLCGVHSPGTRVAGLWRGSMEAITIQIITSVIKETLGENSSELILPQGRLGSREKKGCRDLEKLHLLCCIFFSWPKGSGNRAVWQIPAYRLSCLHHPGFLWAHPDCKMKHASLPPIHRGWSWVTAPHCQHNEACLCEQLQ